MALADVGQGQVGLHAEIGHRALSGGIGGDVPVQELADALQGLQADAGVGLARVQNGHQHDGPGLLLRQRLAHGAGVGADDVPLEGLGLLRGNDIAHVLPKASGHAIDSPVLRQKAVNEPPVGPDVLAELRGEDQLGVIADHRHELLQGVLAVGETDLLDAGRILIQKRIHKGKLPFLFHACLLPGRRLFLRFYK